MLTEQLQAIPAPKFSVLRGDDAEPPLLLSRASVQSPIAHRSVPWERRRPMATHLPRILLFTLTAILVWPSPAPAQRPAVLVNPHVQGNGTAKTIQEGIGMVDPGGKVMVLPGTYAEAVTIGKGLTLEAVGGESRSEEHTSELQSPCNLVCRL